jgi:hypothetical protein
LPLLYCEDAGEKEVEAEGEVEGAPVLEVSALDSHAYNAVLLAVCYLGTALNGSSGGLFSVFKGSLGGI